MRPVSLTDVAGYLPGEPVPAEFFTEYPAAEDPLRGRDMFKVPPWRHHAAPDETNVDLIEQAVQPLIERHGAGEIRGVDVLLVHSQLPDQPIVGAGPEVARRLGLRPEWIIDVATGGCASFIYMLKLAKQLIASGAARSALICNAQNMAGQFFVQSEVRGLAQAAIPGDGCGVGYLTTSAFSPILDVTVRHISSVAGEMRLVCEDGRKYWAAGTSQARIGFTETGTTDVLERGNRLVPDVVNELCERLGIDSIDIDLLVTNQPNRAFLHNWRERLQVSAERHPDTFSTCGNLFGAGIPVTLDRALDEGTIEGDSLLVLGGFAHAGDFAAAAAIGGMSR